MVVFTVLSELDFWKPVDAINKMNEVLIRYNSRFSSVRHYFGGIICDTSAKDINSSSDKFKESVPESELFSVAPSHWDVKKSDYIESHGVTFDFYRGDSKTLPRILEEGEADKDETIDKERIIKVPIQLKYHFLNDPIKSLNDLGGYAYSNKDLLFSGDISHILKNSTIRRGSVPEIIVVDFYDKNQKIYDQVSNLIEMIPRMTHLFLHFDLGIKRDVTGFAITYYEGETVDPDSDVSYPTFRVPIMGAIGRKKGQSTSLDHIYQFIKKLTDRYTLTVSFDSFASQGLLQSLQHDSIDCRTISVDRTTDAYFMLKNVINSDRVKMCYCDRFLRECSELKVVTNGNHVKVDHPMVSSCTDFDYKGLEGDQPGSKDVADSVAASIFSCYKSYSENLESGYSAGIKQEINAIKKITPTDAREQVQKHFQSMLEDIF